MLRALEIGLFLLPFVLFFAWRLAGGGVPSAPLVGAAVGVMIVFAVSLAWLASSNTLGPGQRYVPPHTENGRIVPGHGL